MRQNTLASFAAFVPIGREDLVDSGAYSIVYSEACFIPGVKAEEEGVVWERIDALGERGADERGLKRGCMRSVEVEQLGEDLVEILACRRSRWERTGECTVEVRGKDRECG